MNDPAAVGLLEGGVAPHNPKKLVGTQWTSLDVEEDRRHWEVVEFHRSTEEVILRAVLDGHRHRLKWRGLRDRELWKPGWL